MTTPTTTAAPGAPGGDAAPGATAVLDPPAGGQPADTGTTTTTATTAPAPAGRAAAEPATGADAGRSGDARTGERQGDDGETADVRLEDLPPKWQKYVKDARRGEETKRVAAKEAADKATALERQLQEQAERQKKVLDGVAKAFGLIEETPDEPATPEKLAAQLSDAQARYRETQIELAVYRAAGTAGGDPDALLDSRGFLTKVLKFDPTADDFGDKVTAAITSAIEANPKLRAAVAAAPTAQTSPSGGQFAGGSGGRTDAESLSIEDFRKRRRDRRPA